MATTKKATATEEPAAQPKAHKKGADCWCSPKAIGLPDGEGGKVTHYMHRRRRLAK